MQRRQARPRTAAPWLAALVLWGASCAACAQAVQDTGDYLRRMDRNGDGRIDLDEYLAWMSYGFDARDGDGDGMLTGAELPGGAGPAVTREQYRARLIERFHRQDANGDGYLSARELLAPPR